MSTHRSSGAAAADARSDATSAIDIIKQRVPDRFEASPLRQVQGLSERLAQTGMNSNSTRSEKSSSNPTSPHFSEPWSNSNRSSPQEPFSPLTMGSRHFNLAMQPFPNQMSRSSSCESLSGPQRRQTGESGRLPSTGAVAAATSMTSVAAISSITTLGGAGAAGGGGAGVATASGAGASTGSVSSVGHGTSRLGHGRIASSPDCRIASASSSTASRAKLMSAHSVSSPSLIPESHTDDAESPSESVFVFPDAASSALSNACRQRLSELMEMISTLEADVSELPPHLAFTSTEPPSVFPLVRVNMDFTASSAEELTVLSGDIIELMSERPNEDDGWWTGMRCGKVGLFPRRVVDPLPKSVASCVARALMAIEGTSSDDLECEKLELVEILSKHSRDVWTGKLRDQIGLIPRRCVMLLVEEQEQRESSDDDDDDESASEYTECIDDILSDSESSLPTFQQWEINFSDLELGDYLGRGGFSHVVKAKLGERTVAVKKLLTDNTNINNLQVAKKLRMEAQVFSQLSHRNIVRFLGVCSVPPNFCIVMEFVEKGQLNDHLHETLPPRRVLDWAIQVANGMHYLHEEAPQSIIHRDLKSNNILVSTDLILKISDFGLARAYYNKTTRMSGAGTCAWMAPEVIRGQGAVFASDIWSLGCVVIEMITALPPWSHLEPMAAIFHIGSSGAPPELPDKVGAQTKEFIARCLVYSASGRATAAELLRHPFLEAVEAAKGTSA
eukprot:m.150678 g.150678  ORF g.150678 m.150678 type:complete len:731 (+) comp16884_c0_seq2:320-2512(+)